MVEATKSYKERMREALQLLLSPRSDDQIGDLRRQEAPQPAHALDFAYLVGDPLFELLV